MKIKLRKVRNPITDEGMYEMLADSSQTEQYMMRHCLSPFFPGRGPGYPCFPETKLPIVLELLEAHNVELEIIDE